MSDSQITKLALAQSMKKLMEKRPMKKISVSDIVKECNLNRQTFYYHFKDKYDLVNWIFYTELIVYIKDTPMEKLQVLEKICEYFYENKEFYKNAFEERGQNSFSEYFTETMHNIMKIQLGEVFKNKKDLEFYTTFYADAIRLAISKWLMEGAEIPPDKFVSLLKNTILIAAQYLSED